jgi:ATP-dependent Clp protease ATP-binding subunit ClpC
MIVTDKGLDPQYLEPEFARLLGNGSGIKDEAVTTNCEKIEPAHFIAFLARAGGSVLRVRFLEPRQVSPERFCESLYDVALDEAHPPGTPLAFNSASLSDAAQMLVATFEQEIKKRGLQQGSEVLFTLVLMRTSGDAVRPLLAATAGSEEELERFCASLERLPTAAPRPAFDESGRIADEAFDKSGKRLLSRLAEETAALGYQRVNSLHLLYALIGIESGALPRAIQFQGIDPIREIHSHLARELTRPGAKRVADFKLNRASLHESVARVLELAAGDAQRESLPISELHVARAFMAAAPPAVIDLLKSRGVNHAVVREYLARAEMEAEESAQNVRLSIVQIETELKKRIFGQDHAISRVLPWIEQLRFDYPNEGRPAAVFLFLGPTGTGKTQLAKEIARTVFGSEDDLIMIEMGQFKTKESLSIFVGAAPGYVGYGEGKLTNGLRDKPQSVVLLDEVEKADTAVFDALLRFLDEGLIMDPAGPVRDGRRCIIVMTSNRASASLGELVPPDRDLNERDPETRRRICEVLLKSDPLHPDDKPFRIELLGRVDDMILFRPLNQDSCQLIVERLVRQESTRFFELKGITLQVTPEALHFLTAKALERSPGEGARGANRIVREMVVTPAIRHLMAHPDERLQRIVVSKLGENLIAEEGGRDDASVLGN